MHSRRHCYLFDVTKRNRGSGEENKLGVFWRKMLARRAFDGCEVCNIPQFSRRVRDLKQITRETTTGKFLKEGYNGHSRLSNVGSKSW